MNLISGQREKEKHFLSTSRVGEEEVGKRGRTLGQIPSLKGIVRPKTGGSPLSAPPSARGEILVIPLEPVFSFSKS